MFVDQQVVSPIFLHINLFHDLLHLIQMCKANFLAFIFALQVYS